MSHSIPKIQFPELFFGFVAPVGADITSTVSAFRAYFEAKNYKVVEIKVTNGFEWFSRHIQPLVPLAKKPLLKRYETYIAYGDQLRSILDDDVLAAYSIARIMHRRSKISQTDEERYSKIAYLVHQFKRPEEIELLRSVYGALFFQISVYSRRGARVTHLSERFAKDNNSGVAEDYRSDAEKLCRDDENEKGEDHGQRVGKVFHDADVIISLDADTQPDDQVSRFCNLLFSANFISPSRMEYGLFMAKAAALRTLDLSRQVGAAIFSGTGEIIALGSNEVPKASGGTYWPDEDFDDREFKRNEDSNEIRKRELLTELLSAIDQGGTIEGWLSKPEIRDSQFMDALEYGRIVHAEMSAISDAARLGRSTAGSTLYVTAFPCHMCAKHIVAAGVSQVVFLEPYPKSLAARLHSDSIGFEGRDRGRYKMFPGVEFQHFHGVTPRRYHELFERGKRKDKSGSFIEYGGDGVPKPIMDVKAPFYNDLEVLVLQDATQTIVKIKQEQQQSEFDDGLT